MAHQPQRAPLVHENEQKPTDAWRADTLDVTMLPVERRRSLQDHLLRCLHEPVSGMDLVSGLAGDRALSPTQRASIDAWRQNRGDAFYSDVLFTLTHEHFAAEEARGLWEQVLAHKESLE